MASNYNLKRSDLPKYVKWPDLKGFMQGLPGSGLSELVTVVLTLQLIQKLNCKKSHILPVSYFIYYWCFKIYMQHWNLIQHFFYIILLTYIPRRHLGFTKSSHFTKSRFTKSSLGFTYLSDLIGAWFIYWSSW